MVGHEVIIQKKWVEDIKWRWDTHKSLPWTQ